MPAASELAPALTPPRTARVVAALAFTEIVSWGVLYYAFGVLVPPMQAELGWSQGMLGGAFSLALFVSALLAVPVGRWIQRHGARGLMTAGSCAGAALVWAWSRVEQPVAFYALFVALGFPLAAVLYEAAFAAVVALLGSGRRTDVALLVLTIVAGLASTVFVPLTQALLAAHGWRTALQVLALGLGVLTIPLHALVLPRSRGSALTARAADIPAHTAAPDRARLALTAVAYALATLAATSLGVYLVPILHEQGFTAEFTATAAAMIGVGQVLGRVGFTWLRPRWSLERWSALLFLPPAVGLAWLAAGPGRAGVVFAVLLFAASTGAQTLGRAAWTLELFAPASFARVNGIVGRWSLIGRAAGPFLLGAAHDATGSHGAGASALAVLFAAAGACAWRAAARAPDA